MGDMEMVVVLSVATDGHRNLKHEADNMRFPKLSWDIFDMINNFSTYLQSNLETLSPYDSNQCINTYIDKLNDLLHDAAIKTSGPGKKLFEPKPDWCHELSRLRIKRFLVAFMRLERAASSPAVYQCYKDA